jgi:serine/threonine-protein kinase HipA
VTDERIREMFDEVAASPLGNNSIRRLSSLAGVQDKVLLARVEGQWVEPLDGYPSTHILKPLSGKYRTLIFDEEYGSRFARARGLAAFDTEVVAFDGRQALVIERYDRDVDGTRVHQEDFNQALGYRGDQKYELVPDGRLRAIAGVLREHSSQRERQRLLQMVTLSAALGNLDMHAKNISVLHEPGGEMRLAPMYDVVPQLHMDGIDQTLALYIANTNDPHLVCGGDLLAEGESWGLRAPRAIVTDALEQIHAVAEQEIPHPGAEQSMPQTIADRTARLLNSLERITPPVPLPPADRPFTPRTAGGGWGGPAQR